MICFVRIITVVVLSAQSADALTCSSINNFRAARACPALSAVVEKIETNDSLLQDLTDDLTSSPSNNAVLLGEAELERSLHSNKSGPSLTVTAGKGALITSNSDDILVKGTGSISSLKQESPQMMPTLTVSHGRGANVTSVSAGVSIVDRMIHTPKQTETETNKLPLRAVKTLVDKNKKSGVGAVGKVFSAICRVAPATTSRVTAAPESASRSYETKQNSSPSDWKLKIQSAASDMLIEDEARQQSETSGLSSTNLLPTPDTILLCESPYTSSGIFNHHITIRSLAPNSHDDKFIANLRLSVFSNYDEERQNLFRYKSIEVLHRRRRRGAVALIAEMPHEDFKKVKSHNEIHTRIASGHNYNAKVGQQDDRSKNKIIGSVECSQHEFDRTILGRSRPKNSLLYVTEVAVFPEARRCGVGRMLMKGAEEVARLRGCESIYLHVDVTNHAAISMYEKAGYQVLDKKRRIYAQFTATLNLHDGALMGRCHSLMCKHLVEDTTWIVASDR